MQRCLYFPKAAAKKLIDVPFTATLQQIQHGSILFTQYCGTCHSDIGIGGGTIPDLGYSSEATHKIFQGYFIEGITCKQWNAKLFREVK